MIIKTKALIITLGIMIGGIALMYALLTHTRIVIGVIMAIIGILGAKLTYTEILSYLQDQERIKNSKWNKRN
jgi:hypothetical protein